MSTSRRLAVVLLALTAFVMAPLAAMADEARPADTRDGDTTTTTTLEHDTTSRDRRTDEVITDEPVVTDGATRVDHPARDRVVDRCRPNIVDNRGACPHDEVRHDVDIRHLIWRLINAHEWTKLLRLLHRLGWF